MEKEVLKVKPIIIYPKCIIEDGKQEKYGFEIYEETNGAKKGMKTLVRKR